MEILLILISSPLKLITISCMRYSLPRIIFRYHLSTASLLIVYWVLSREKEHDTAGIMLQLSVCSKCVANAKRAGIGVNLLKQSGGMPYGGNYDMRHCRRHGRSNCRNKGNPDFKWSPRGLWLFSLCHTSHSSSFESPSSLCKYSHNGHSNRKWNQLFRIVGIAGPVHSPKPFEIDTSPIQ